MPDERESRVRQAGKGEPSPSGSLRQGGRPHLLQWLLEDDVLLAQGAPAQAVRPIRARQPTPEPPRDRSRCGARALVSVMLCDGRLRDSERRFVDEFLNRCGLEPLCEEEVRRWRPGELLCPDRPSEVVEAMARLVYLDSEPDPSECQLVREFARAWRVSPESLERFRSDFDSDEDAVEALRRVAQSTWKLIEQVWK